MSTEATPQILNTAVEHSGLSVVTTTKTASDPRFGSIYRPDLLAAAQPVWFHALQDGRYIGLFAERWTGATVGSGGPQTYSAHTVSAVPSWGVISPATGATDTVTEIPSRLSGTRILTGAGSRVNYLYTVGTCDGVPLIQHHRVSEFGQLIIAGEELLPAQGDTAVEFNAGCYIEGDWLFVFGIDEDGLVYQARKHWGDIGQVQTPWSYRGTGGWFEDSEELVPLLAVGSPPLPIVASEANISHASFAGREYIAIPEGAEYQILSSRAVDSVWKEAGDPIPADWFYFQPHLRPNRNLLPDGKRTGIPYVYTDEISTADAQSLNVAWGLLAI